MQVQQLSSTGGNATHPKSLGSFHLFEARELKTGFSVRFQLYLKSLNEEISSVYTGNVFHFDDWQSTLISETLTSSFVTSSSERWPWMTLKPLLCWQWWLFSQLKPYKIVSNQDWFENTTFSVLLKRHHSLTIMTIVPDLKIAQFFFGRLHNIYTEVSKTWLSGLNLIPAFRSARLDLDPG